MAKDSIRGSSDRGILVVASLAGSPEHGYALIKDIEDFAGVRLWRQPILRVPSISQRD
jgi:DNA-binding PadR family transcriptional regulator